MKFINIFICFWFPNIYGFSTIISNVSQSSSRLCTPRKRFETIQRRHIRRYITCLEAKLIPSNEEELLSQLKEYLDIRKDAQASQNNKMENEKEALGGSRGNVFLEFTSTSPQVIVPDKEKGALDYDELTKYGFSHLVKPIMQSGGRNGLYAKLGLTPPPTPERLRPKTARKLEIDREGDKNPKRYTGLKMTSIMNDEEMAAALQKSLEKEEDSLKSPEEEFTVPFSDLPQKKYKETPYWTPEMVDRDAEVRGKAISWAKNQRIEREKGIVKDENEKFEIEGSLRIYSVFTLLATAIAFGKSTPNAIGAQGMPSIELLQAPVLGLDVASIGSSFVAAIILAPEKNRNSFVWGLKGLFGGPFALLKLRDLNVLPEPENTTS